MMGQRWTIVARCARGQRRPGEAMRERVQVRCVCGFERVVWLQDMQTGRTTGCDSRICAARYLAAEDIRVALRGWSDHELRTLEDAVGPRATALRRALGDLAREREASIERVIDAFLHGPREAPEDMVAIR